MQAAFFTGSSSGLIHLLFEQEDAIGFDSRVKWTECVHMKSEIVYSRDLAPASGIFTVGVESRHLHPEMRIIVWNSVLGYFGTIFWYP